MAHENLSGQPHDHDAAGVRVRRGFITLRDMRIPACFCTDENPDNTPSNHRYHAAEQDPAWDMEAGELRFTGLSGHIVMISPTITAEQMERVLLEIPPITRAMLVAHAQLIVDSDRLNRERGQ